MAVALDIRGQQAKVEFRSTVFSVAPFVTETKILDLIDVEAIPAPVTLLRTSETRDTEKYEIRQRAAHLLVCNRDGQLSNARTDLLPHQISVAHEVLSRQHNRFLMADDVGLGKTIEAGLVYFALLQRGEATRTLIVTPAGLTLQWQEEMEDKFAATFLVYGRDIQGPLAFEYNDHVIASIDTLKLDRPRRNGDIPGHKSILLGARDWDLVIFDEAHKLSAKTWSEKKREKTQNYRLAEDLKDRCRSMLLLTATPHQGDESKFRNLIHLLSPRATLDSWEKRSPEDIDYSELVLRNRKSKVTDAEGKPLFKDIEIHPVHVALRDDGEKQFHQALLKYLKEGYGYAEQDPSEPHRKAIGFVMTTFQKLAASSTPAIKKALGKRRDNLKRQVEEEVGWEEGEYDARYEGEIDEERVAADSTTFMQGELEINWLSDLIEQPVPGDGKADELLQAIGSLPKSELVLIFTEYRGTQRFLCALLEAQFGRDCTVQINGDLKLHEKRRSQVRFRDDPRVRFLVSTEAGGEGVNLQFCHIQINYDLPWNPFRLAQRYGRLYRYGQDKVVQVFNFENVDTIEEKVRDYLEKKTRTAAERLSALTGETPREIEEGLLGLYEEYLDYKKIYREGLIRGNVKTSRKAIDRAVKKAEEAYHLAHSSLFSRSIAPFNPDRFHHEIESPLTLEDVRSFVELFVRHHGRNFQKDAEGYFTFLLPDCLKGTKGIEPRYQQVTFSREEAMQHTHLEFMALGHPFVDAAIRCCGSPEFGGTAAHREIPNSRLAGTRGVQFNFMVKRTDKGEERERVFFELEPVFFLETGECHAEAAEQALLSMGRHASHESEFSFLDGLNLEELETRGRTEVLGRYKDDALWDEDVMLLGAAAVVFV